MTTVQERLRQSRTPLDKWTTREQLCLASAVSCSGDQNWMSVSRTMRQVCGSGPTSVARPSDWYSQKSCAVQYGHLLENVETPKRKKRTSESNSNDSPATVDTPTDLVLRRLTEERVQELRDEIRKDQEEYAKLYREIKALQSNDCSEERLLAMWREMEKDEEAKRISEMKLENQMREREQRKQELQRSWRNAAPAAGGAVVKAEAPATETAPAASETAAEKSTPPLLNIQLEMSGNQQQQQPQTSPLLSSLLKSPTSTAPPPSATTTTSSARTTAPTITTLLTGGSIASQPVVIVKNKDVEQLLTRPISGPLLEGTITTAASQQLISPSQSAPTLSMLLEKTKGAVTTVAPSSLTSIETNKSTNKVKQEGIETALKSETRPDSNNDEVPMDLEEDLAAAVGVVSSANADASTLDSDEPDPNEEQQLLEVFKNIGNIELEIDAEFLNGMDEESPNDAADITNFDSKIEPQVTTSKPLRSAEEKFHIKVEAKEVQLEKLEEAATVAEKPNGNDIKAAVENDDKKIMNSQKVEEIKVETISSDDSNDNIPLATVASLEVKERQYTDDAKHKELLKDKLEQSGNKVDQDEVLTSLTPLEKPENNDNSLLSSDVETSAGLRKNLAAVEKLKEKEVSTSEQKSPSESENSSSDVILIPTDDDESNQSKQAEKPGNKLSEETNEELEETSQLNKDNDNNLDLDSGKVLKSNQEEIHESSDAAAIVVPTISIPDTDEDSSTTDISIVVRKEVEKLPNKLTAATQQKLSEDSDSMHSIATPTVPLSATPARPPALRKLRERDRSESPMIGEEERPRRRGSSTPLIDSVPDSPASASDREERDLRAASKKSLLNIYVAMQQKHSKEISLLENSFSDTTQQHPTDSRLKYEDACLRPMDFQVIKRHIESGVIRSTLELQRDILLFCQNAVMFYTYDTPQHRAAMQLKQDCRNLHDLSMGEKTNTITDKETKNKEMKSSNSNVSNSCSTTGSTAPAALQMSASKGRSGFRKSLRIP